MKTVRKPLAVGAIVVVGIGVVADDNMLKLNPNDIGQSVAMAVNASSTASTNIVIGTINGEEHSAESVVTPVTVTR